MSAAAEQQTFLQLHRGLPREGPGRPEDVAWAVRAAGVTPGARVLDAACGPGGDIDALLAAVPGGQVTGVDKIAHFVGEARVRHAGRPGLKLVEGDMMAQAGPFDFIWCAGAVYFVGVRAALEGWRRALSPEGCIAFSQICWFTPAPPRAAVDFWAACPDMTDETGVHAQIVAAGFEVRAQHRLSERAWENYYTPLDARIAALRPDAEGHLTKVLDEATQEAGLWRAHRDAFGYTLFVVRPR